MRMMKLTNFAKIGLLTPEFFLSVGDVAPQTPASENQD